MAGRASHGVPSSPNVTPFPSHCPPHPPFQLRSEPQPSASQCQTFLSQHTLPYVQKCLCPKQAAAAGRGAGPSPQVPSLSRSLQQTLQGGRGRRKERSVHRDSTFVVREALLARVSCIRPLCVSENNTHEVRGMRAGSCSQETSVLTRGVLSNSPMTWARSASSTPFYWARGLRC